MDTRKPMAVGPPLILVLAGGRSRRFGRDKARVEVDGEPLIVRTVRVVRVLQAVQAVQIGRAAAGREVAGRVDDADPAEVAGQADSANLEGAGLVADVVVAGERSLADLFTEPPEFLDDPREGPLGAVVAAWRAFGRPLVVLACDLPALDPATVVKLMRPTAMARVPMVEGTRQWLAAHYGATALQTMDTAWEEGERSMWRIGQRLDLEPEETWDPVALADADTAEDLESILRRANPRRG